MASSRNDARLWALMVDELRTARAEGRADMHRIARRLVVLVRRERATTDARTFGPGEAVPLDVVEVYDLDGDRWERQSTHPENRVNPQPGDPAPPLAATGQPRVAYALRSEPGEAGQGHNTTYVAETLRSHPRPGSNSNGAVVAHTLAAEGHDASEDGTGRGTPLVPMSLAVGQDFATGDDLAMPITGSNGQPGTVALATAVRRLTPVEAERLQGLPDGWTATSNGRPQSDSARYRQLGNSVAVPVFAWVARRLVAVEAITDESIEVNTHDLHPTRTRLALLRAVAAGDVIRDLDCHDYDRRGGWRRVDARIAELAYGGWVEHVDGVWRLTEAGRQGLAQHTGSTP